jgi:Cu(I)/Ag(I) efflux system membrane protein CusA/SilA
VTRGERGLIVRIIHGSIANPVAVLLAAALLACAGIWALRDTRVDVLPDLSDVQVIIRTSFPGQAPQLVENQVTFPLTSALIAVPGATTVRGYSFFGDSFVYVLFKDGTDPYWARSRVLESLQRVQSELPAGARVSLGPDATGVGWVYEYALVDRTGRSDLARLRALQDWWLRFELRAVDGVAEVATVGGMVKEYQVILDPVRLRAQGVPVGLVRRAIEAGNRESGGAIVELAEAEYMVRASGYVRGIADLENIPVRTAPGLAPILLRDVASVRLGPAMRRGIADLDGAGETVGGVVIVRYGADTQQTIARVRARLAELATRLPDGVEFVTTYDRSGLIDRAIRSLGVKLIEEFAVVLLVCLVFLAHWRSGLVILLFLPLSVLGAFLIMRVQGIGATIMSLAGIGVAIGTMVDAAIVMIENLHKKLESAAARGETLENGTRLRLIAESCSEVGRALFFSLLIVALSFAPVLALEAEEGRLFAPLAYTKTWAMVAAALLSITLVPVLIAMLVRGRIRAEGENPVNRGLAAAYRPALTLALRHPRAVIIGTLMLVLVSLWPATRLGTEFMPAMDEGDLLYMPMTQPGISADAARALLQRTDAAIRRIPEVQRVFGKAGRAETATDPAPLEMLETVVQLKPRSEWRSGLTPEALRAELDASVRFPGVTNAWLPPIQARVDMLSTGVRTPLGIRVSGPDLQKVAAIVDRVEQIVRAVPGTESVYAERAMAGRFIDIDVNRATAARYGLSIDDVHDVIALAVGGEVVGETVEGRERYPISVRYPQEWRDSLATLRALPVVTAAGTQIALGDLAELRFVEGPSMIRTEGAEPSSWLFITARDRDVTTLSREAQRQIDAAHILPAGYTLHWTGQYEHIQRAFGKLATVAPLTLGLIVLLLFLSLRSLTDVLLVLGTLPVALVGAAWLAWALDYRMSVAVAIGCIALAGVAAETGILMLMFLKSAWDSRRATNAVPTSRHLHDAIMEGAVARLRPKIMTVTTIIAGLLPMLFGHGTGSEVMRRIAAPMVGGILSATLLTLFVIPALFLLVQRRHVQPD